MTGDLVVVALPGVQRFVQQSRRTGDLRAASEIVASLARVAVDTIASNGGELVIPTTTERAGVPNRVVALVPAGAGSGVARTVEADVAARWRGWLHRLFPDREIETPGFPVVQWACASDHGGGYAGQWRAAQQALGARRRVRDFPAVDESGRWPCALSPQWIAEQKPPAGARSRAGERQHLAAANWVKRRWGALRDADTDDPAGFPSTSSIASAPMRRSVLRRLDEPSVREAVRALRDAVTTVTRGREVPVPGLDTAADHTDDLARWLAESGGPWVYGDRWDPVSLAVEAGRGRQQTTQWQRAAGTGARAQRALLTAVGGQAPADYLALVAQDLDGMGRFLGGAARNRAGARLDDLTAAKHQEVSGRLVDVGRAQWAALRSDSLLGVPVYAAGDDLLSLVPAETALAAARHCHDLVPDGLPTASSAVLFFHHGSALQRAVRGVRDLLEAAKAADPAKHALAVGFLRRSGARQQSIQPWLPRQVGSPDTDGRSAADLFGVFGAESGRLSPRLAVELERDEAELSTLDSTLWAQELRRLVVRHGGRHDDATALARLGTQERAGGAVRGFDGATRAPAAAARVAVFLRQEARAWADAPQHDAEAREAVGG